MYRTFPEQAPQDQAEMNVDIRYDSLQPENVNPQGLRVLYGAHPIENPTTSVSMPYTSYGPTTYIPPQQMPVSHVSSLQHMSSQPSSSPNAMAFDSRLNSALPSQQSLIRQPNIPERGPPMYFRCLHNLPASRERRLALGLEESEEVLHCDIRTPNSNGLNETTTLSIWTTSKSSASSITRDVIKIAFEVSAWRAGRNRSWRSSSRTRLLYQIIDAIVAAYVDGIDADHIKSAIHDTITNAHHRCISCGKDLGTKNLLYRSTTCSAECSVKFRHSALEVRAPGLENYNIYYGIGDALRVLWVAAMIAVRSKHMSPPPFMTVEDVCHALKIALQLFRIPKTMSPDEKHFTFNKAIRALKRDPKTERFVAWSSTHYRGCLIPSRDFPNRSWLYAYNANPAIEKAYARNWDTCGKRSSIVFHGTTVDRLYPIMCDGFRDDHNLVQNGRRYGSGVYVTDSQDVALDYARTLPHPSWMNRHVDVALCVPFHMQVLLVCELLDGKRFLKDVWKNISGTGSRIYVVNEPNMLILRAVLIGTEGKGMPALSGGTLQRAIRR